MEYYNPSLEAKDLSFGLEGKNKILIGVEKLADAVSSTLGASGKCVIYQDAMGKPVITKDGVTVAESVVLEDPVENIGATLIKEAASNTVKEAGDGTTTATVLAHSLLKRLTEYEGTDSLRELKDGIDVGFEKVIKYLDKVKTPITTDTLHHVASISCNNDKELGKLISDAFKAVGENGVVLMEESNTETTFVDIVDGVQLEAPLKSKYLATDSDRGIAELDKPYILVVMSKIPNIRKIERILEFVHRKGRPLLIVGELDVQPYQTLIANKVKGNIKVNFVDPPGFGKTKPDTMQDIAILTGATLINEDVGDDLDFIDESVLGEAVKATTNSKTTVLQIEGVNEQVADRIKTVETKIAEEKNGYMRKKLEERLAMLSGGVAIIRVGANSKVELKEKKDRVEDALFAVKAALTEGIIPGGGVAFKNAAERISANTDGESILLEAVKQPYYTILDNALIDYDLVDNRMAKGRGIDVVQNKAVNMVNSGIIDPVFVSKTALKNAVSVVKTIISADCIISNKIK